MRERPSRTAELVAWMRAAERRRPAASRVLDDPFAKHFLSAATRAALPTAAAVDRATFGLCSYIATRHRYLDEALATALADDAVASVLVLGAGYDTRAWRFADRLGARPIAEVDHPATHARKLRLSAGLPARPAGFRAVPADLAREPVADVLARLDLAGPAFVILEGVSMYLTEAQLTATLDAVGERFGPGTRLALDVWFRAPDRRLLDVAAATVGLGLAVLGEPVKFTLNPGELPAWLARRGWTAVDVAGPAVLSTRYLPGGRELSPLFACAVAEREPLG